MVKKTRHEELSLEQIDKILLSKNNKIFSLNSAITALSSSESTLSSLKRAFIYLHSKNVGAFEREIENLINLTYSLRTTSFKDQADLVEYENLITRIYKLNPNNKIFNIYLISQIHLVDEQFKLRLKEYLSEWALDYLNNLDSPSYGLKYPDVWAKWAYNNLKPNKFLKQFKKVNFKNLPHQQLNAFKYYRGLSDNKLKSYLPRLKKLKNSSKKWERDLFYSILSNKSLAKDLKRLDKSIVPSISQRREFYKKSLLQMHSINDNVYRLFSMGDIQYEYFIYALAVRSYGLPSTKFLQIK